MSGCVEFLSQSLGELQKVVRSIITGIGAIKHLEDEVHYGTSKSPHHLVADTRTKSRGIENWDVTVVIQKW